MIQIARHNHLDEIDHIYNQAVEEGLRTAHQEPVSREERLRWFESHDKKTHPIFVYTRDKHILGWLSVSAYRSGRKALNEVAEVSFYVDYDHHGQGIGSKLLDHCCNFCRNTSIRVLVAILISGNKKSIGLLKKFNFEEWGRIPAGIHHNGVYRDHLYMGLRL